MKFRISMKRYVISLLMILLVMTAFLNVKTYAYTTTNNKKITNIKTITITTDKTIKILDKYTNENKYSRGNYENISAENNEIVKNAVSKLGSPYMIGSSGPNSFDDAGFVTYIYNKSGVEIENKIKSQLESGTPIIKEELKSGDLVFFNCNNDKVSHVGVYIGDNKFIHSEKESGRVIITSIDDDYYKKVYVGAKRILNN